MRDYWLTQYILGGIGWAYLLVSAIALFLALKLPKTTRGKMTSFAVVLALVSILPFQGVSQFRAQREVAGAHAVRYAKAQALFEDRCKTAGERIQAKVTGVSEIALVNPRALGVHSRDIADADWQGAGFALESTGVQYVMEFLYHYEPASGLRASELRPRPAAYPGYRYVHVVEDGVHFRYRLREPETFTSRADPLESYGEKQEVTSPLPRYVVEYENVPDPEGRENWIAGGRIKVFDRKSGEFLGESLRFNFEPGLGSRDGFRQPWAFARSCPTGAYDGATGHIRRFVQKVLIPEGSQQ